MAFRFRKSFKVAPGVRFNLGKKSASVSVGGKGGRITTGTSGTRASASVPGTGVGYTKKISGSSKSTQDEPGRLVGVAIGCLFWAFLFVAGAVFLFSSSGGTPDREQEVEHNINQQNTITKKPEQDLNVISSPEDPRHNALIPSGDRVEERHKPQDEPMKITKRKEEKKAPSQPKTSAAEEKRASKSLKTIKTYLLRQKPELAQKKLKELVEKYPETKAAEEAKKLIEK